MGRSFATGTPLRVMMTVCPGLDFPHDGNGVTAQLLLCVVRGPMTADVWRPICDACVDPRPRRQCGEEFPAYGEARPESTSCGERLWLLLVGLFCPSR
jgi:hypothetical protein